jgi:hypothetical protein
MTPDEGYKILADSLLQTENSKGGYLLGKAKEMAIDPISFFTDLKSLYDTMEKHVNSIDHNHWGVDDEGNREAIYKTINLYQLTNGSHRGFLVKENIRQFLPGLEQFGQKIMTELKKDQTDKNRELIELLKTEIESKKDTSTAKLTGFTSSLSDPQIETLYSKMNGNYFEATPDNFKAIFKNEPLPPDCSIQWIDTGITRHEPNKQTLFEFLYLLKEYQYLNISNFDTKPKNDNNLYRKLETIFPGFKNFPESNPTATQKKTPRQKLLETIIFRLKS